MSQPAFDDNGQRIQTVDFQSHDNEPDAPRPDGDDEAKIRREVIARTLDFIVRDAKTAEQIGKRAAILAWAIRSPSLSRFRKQRRFADWLQMKPTTLAMALNKIRSIGL